MSDDNNFSSTFLLIIVGLVVAIAALVYLASNLTSRVAEQESEDVVVANIKSVGSVYVAGESEAADEVAAAPAEEAVAGETAPAAAAASRSGEAVYNASCGVCHGAGVAGAPRLGDAAAWSGRVAAGMDAMLANAVKGLNAMPPRGTCANCSDDELRAAIDYMVTNSQ